MLFKLIKNKLAVNTSFLLFVFLSLFLSILLSALLVGSQTKNTIHEYQEQKAQIEAGISARYIEQFIETRLQLLHDLAKQPVLVNGVMGAGMDRASLFDLLDDYNILGQKQPILLLNVLSEKVYSNDESFSFDVQEDWTNKLLMDEIPHAISLQEMDGRYYFELAVPIKYNGLTEGLMVVYFLKSLNELLEEVINSDTYGIELEGPWLSFSTYQSGVEYQPVSRLELGESELVLTYQLNTQSTIDKVSTVLGSIIWAIGFSLVIAWAILYLIGQKLLLDPYRRLAQSEREIKLSEERYKVAVEGSSDGLWDWDIENKSVYYAPRFREMLGYDGNDTENFPNIYSSFENALHKKDVLHTVARIKAHLRDKEPFDVEYRLFNKAGEIRYFRAKGTAVWNDAGWATRMAGSIIDITEQKLAQKALQQAKEQNDLLAQAIEACNLGIAILDGKKAENPLLFINSGFEKITGYGSEVLGSDCRFLRGEKTSLDAVNDINQALADATKLRTELINYRKDGSEFWNSVQISPIYDENKSLIAFVSILEDISERIATNNALEDAKQAAENANKAKSEFLASMSHEIRTPMNGVLGMLNLLLGSELTQEQQHRISVAMGSANALLNLLNDILDFSKVDAGKLELELLEFDLRKMLGEFAEAAAIQAHEKKLELIIDMAGVTEQLVKGDPGRIRQILTNLVGNAIKFTNQGEVVIKVALSEQSQKNWQLNCEVSDTGIGISKEKQQKLFKSFSQVDASTTRKYGGTGLGLAIAKKLCNLMGGDITVSSEKKKGCTFSFSLTLGKSSTSKPVMPTTNISDLNILIVDDNETNLEVLRGQLSVWGANVVEANSGKAALAACDLFYNKHKHTFDIAFLDMQMPEMNGAELGKQLKQHTTHNIIKLIMMTSMHSQGEAKYFAELGFSGYFPKPATTSDLFDALQIVGDGGDALTKAQPLVTKHYIESLKSDKHDSESELTFSDKTRILLAEDNPVNQMVAKSMLQQLGLKNIEIAPNGNEVLKHLHQSDESLPYHIVLMDCQMPEMDGYEATRAIRNGEAGDNYKNIPIIAMTANAMVGDREKCLDAGMNDYISKPIVQDKLNKKLLAWITL